MRKLIKQRFFLLHIMIKTLGLFMLVIFFLGCGKKGDPVPLNNEPIFSTDNEERASHSLIDPDQGKKESSHYLIDPDQDKKESSHYLIDPDQGKKEQPHILLDVK